ncbi:MAG: molecular chaperone HtpG, partial [Bacteroidota bacterium]
GVLYFPRVTNNFEQHQNKIQLYAKQVFITNEVKDVVPEFLMLLHGVIDSPDIPLNVSRSTLQADSSVKKINTYIAKKVAEKLTELFEQDRKAYEEKWASMDLFVKYGMITDDKFYEKAQEFALLKNTAGKHWTLAEYQAHIKPNQTDKNEELVMLYATEPAKQDQYIQSCTKRGYDVLEMDQSIDQHFMGVLEQKLDKVTLKGVDAAPVGQLIAQDEMQEIGLTEEEQKKLQAVYEKAVADKQVTWAVAAMPADEPPVVITVQEFMKRMQHMTAHGGTQQPPLPLQATINANHALAQKLLKSKKTEKQQRLALQAYNLSLLAQGMLQGAALTDFLQRSVEIMVTE